MRSKGSPAGPGQPAREGRRDGAPAAGNADRDDDRIVNELRDIKVDGAEVLIAGTPAMRKSSIDALFGKLPWMLLYIIVATFILLSLVFGSVILPAKAVIMNLLGTGATLGHPHLDARRRFPCGPVQLLAGSADGADVVRGDRLRLVDGLRGLPASLEEARARRGRRRRRPSGTATTGGSHRRRRDWGPSAALQVHQW
ncbi:hypothetical protein [Corynebacterium variabile]